MAPPTRYVQLGHALSMARRHPTPSCLQDTPHLLRRITRRWIHAWTPVAMAMQLAWLPPKNQLRWKSTDAPLRNQWKMDLLSAFTATHSPLIKRTRASPNVSECELPSPCTVHPAPLPPASSNSHTTLLDNASVMPAIRIGTAQDNDSGYDCQETFNFVIEL